MKKLLLVSFLLTSICSAATTLKVGVLAPEGTSWAKNLKTMAKEIEEKTAGNVKLKVYFGGSQGDESDVLKKIRIDQLQGGIFSGKTLGDINGDVRVMEVPFTFFSDREKGWNVLQKMTPFFNQGFDRNQFVNLGFFEIGLIYLVSQKDMPSMEAVRKIKVWSWTGDPVVEALVGTMKVISVPLALPDVLSSLSTGIIEAAYSPPLAIVSLQWGSKVKYLLDYPLTYSIGAFLISKKSWNAVPAQHRDIISKIATDYFIKVKDANVKENADALKLLKSSGIKFVTFPKSDYEGVAKIRKEVIGKLQGKVFSAEAYKRFETALKEK